MNKCNRFSGPTFFLTLFLSTVSSLHAQRSFEDIEPEPSYIGLVTGIAGLSNAFGIEVGISHMFKNACANGFCVNEGIGFSLEIQPLDKLAGLARVSYWMSSFISPGISVGYLTNFDKGSVVVEPQMGIGTGQLRFFTRMQVAVTNTDAFDLGAEIAINYIVHL